MMKNLKKPLKIGILISRRASYENPKNEWEEMGYVERTIVYSWEEMPAWAQEREDKDTYALFWELGYNKTLARAVVSFRRKFGLSVEEGINFKQHEKVICRVENGPMYKFDKIPELPADKYKQAADFILNFTQKHVIKDPLKIHLPTIFFGGFVDPSFVNLEGVACEIPSIPADTEGTIFQYRPPVKIIISSRDITREKVKKCIDDNWGKIQKYLKGHPFVSDIRINPIHLRILSLHQQGYTAKQILSVLDKAEFATEDVSYRYTDVYIRKIIQQTKEKVQGLIISRK